MDFKWTKEIPTVSGYYWIRRKGYFPNICFATTYDLERYSFIEVIGKSGLIFFKDLEDAKWAGPIQEPIE